MPGGHVRRAPDFAKWRCVLADAASGARGLWSKEIVWQRERGDWEVELSADLQKRWRRQRVRLVFDPTRPTVPRGAWFIAPGSGGGRRILEAALSEPQFTRRTALARVPGVSGSALNFATRRIRIQHDPALPTDQLAAVIARAGYRARVPGKDSTRARKDEERRLLWRLSLAGSWNVSWW